MLVYLDSITAGLVPAKLLAISADTTRVKVTATRGCYTRGDTVDSTTLRTVPRAVVHRPRGAYFPRIGPYQWAAVLFGKKET